MGIQKEELFYVSCDARRSEDCEGFFKNEDGFTLKFFGPVQALEKVRKKGWLVYGTARKWENVVCPACQSLTNFEQDATLKEDEPPEKDSITLMDFSYTAYKEKERR